MTTQTTQRRPHNKFGNPILTDQEKEQFMVSVARGEGGIAFYAGKSVFDCQYETGTDRHEAWVDSFVEAKGRVCDGR